MNAGKLVAMANQIAGFFRAYPPDVAREGISEHIATFWTPAMRRTLVTETPPPGLDELVLAALWTRRDPPA